MSVGPDAPLARAFEGEDGVKRQRKQHAQTKNTTGKVHGIWNQRKKRTNGI